MRRPSALHGSSCRDRGDACPLHWTLQFCFLVLRVQASSHTSGICLDNPLQLRDASGRYIFAPGTKSATPKRSTIGSSARRLRSPRRSSLLSTILVFCYYF